MLAVATLEKIQRRENLYRHWAFVALQMILLWHQSKLSYSAHKAVTFQRPSRKRINKLSLDVIPLFYRIHLWPHHKICVVQHENWRRKDLLYISCICTDNKIKIAVTSMKGITLVWTRNECNMPDLGWTLSLTHLFHIIGWGFCCWCLIEYFQDYTGWREESLKI